MWMLRLVMSSPVWVRFSFTQVKPMLEYLKPQTFITPSASSRNGQVVHRKSQLERAAMSATGSARICSIGIVR